MTPHVEKAARIFAQTHCHYCTRYEHENCFAGKSCLCLEKAQDVLSSIEVSDAMVQTAWDKYKEIREKLALTPILGEDIFHLQSMRKALVAALATLTD